MEFAESEVIQALSNEKEPDSNILRQLVRDPTFLNDSSTVGEVFFSSVEMGFSKSVGIILEGGVSPNIKRWYNGETALHVACQKQCTETTLLLVKCGAKVNAEDHAKSTPLHKASLNRNIENMQILLQNGAMVNAVDVNGLTPLHHASGDVSAIQVLLSAGADVNVSEKFGRAPLHFAVGDNEPQCVRLLLRYKADVNVQENEGDTPLHFASYGVRNSHLMIRELVKGGARLNSLNNKGQSPLYYAVRISDKDATLELLRCGASFDIVECLADPELEYSSHEDLTSIAQELIRYEFVNSLKSTQYQQLRQEKVSNILRNISGPECNLDDFQQACLSEVEALSKLNCDCSMSSIWGSINNWEECKCDTYQAILKFLFSGRHTHFSEVFLHKLSKDFLLEVSLNLISYFTFKESKKRLVLPWPCMKRIEGYVSVEDVVSFLQSKQSEMDVSEFEKYQAFMKEESSVKSSSEISPPIPKRLRVS